MPVVQPPPVSRFAFAKPHEIPSGRVALTGTPLDAKPCLIGHFTLRPGRTVAEAFMAIGPNRNPPPPGGIRHHMLRGATGDTFLFLDILDSYAAVANCLKRLEAHPQALADLAGIVEPGGEAWIGPLCCVPSHMVPRAVVVDVIKHGAVNVTMEPRASAFHKPTVPADVTPSTDGAAAVVVTAAIDSSNDDAWIPPSPDDAVDFPPVESVFFSRYWRHCAINWFTRRPFEAVCSAEVHAYEVEPVWFEMGTSVAGRTPPGVRSPDAESVPAGNHGGTPSPPGPAAPVPMASVTRRGYGDPKQQYTYQHRPHDPPVYRVAEDHGTLITRCSTEQEGLLAAAAAFDQTGFRNLQMRGAGTANGVPPSNHADPSVAIAAVASESEGEAGDERQRRRRGRKPPPMCAQVVDSVGKRRRCHVDPRRVPHLDVGDVLVMAMVTLSQQNQPQHSPLSATMGLGRVTSVTRWSRRKAAIGQQLAEDQHAQQLRAERRATIADVSAAAAAVGGDPLPWAPSAAHAANAAMGGCPEGVVAGIYTSPHLPCHVASAPTGPASSPAVSVPSVFAAVNFNLAVAAAAPSVAGQDAADGTPTTVSFAVLQKAVAATCGVAPGSVFRIAAV